jgi:hypothetical protein
MIKRELFVLWLRTTWFGWLFGVPIIILLSLIGEAIGLGGAQFLVGVGMGIGVGVMQSRVIKDLINRSSSWVWSTIVGLGLPFLVADIWKFVDWKLPYSWPVLIAVGGLIVGIWQAFILSSQVHKIILWAAVDALGWFVAMTIPSLADFLPHLKAVRGIGGVLLYLAGGLILSSITGISLGWIFRQQSVLSEREHSALTCWVGAKEL